MYNFKDDLLTELLGCGYSDLTVLEDCKYDFCDVIEHCQMNFGEPLTLNSLARSMFEIGIINISEAIQERIEELREIEEASEAEAEELQELVSLNPNEDIESFHNFLDTSIYFVNNSDIYHKYLEEALDNFADDTGYTIKG